MPCTDKCYVVAKVQGVPSRDFSPAGEVGLLHKKQREGLWECQGVMSVGPGVQSVAGRSLLVKGEILEASEYLVTVDIVPHPMWCRAATEPWRISRKSPIDLEVWIDYCFELKVQISPCVLTFSSTGRVFKFLSIIGRVSQDKIVIPVNKLKGENISFWKASKD